MSVGLLFVREQHSLKDFFLAGRSMGSLVVAISVLAGLFSGVSYLGAPAEVYTHDFSYALIGLSFFLATPITTLVFLPFLYQSRFYTAYQYLEERFSVQVRMLASALFVFRTLLWLALATYAPALALEQVTGLPLWLTLICTGLLTTVYTTLGGMKAVIWTDVMQFVVLVGGQIVIIATAIRLIPNGIAGVYEINQQAGKFAVNFSLDPTVRVTIWGLVLGGAFVNLVQLASDQLSVQRYLTARSIEEARRALWVKLAATLPVITLFYASGLVLYAFYHSQGDPVKAGRIATSDQILPYFVVDQLPAGMPGLLVAAVYAASMSTVSAGLNAMTTTTLVDFYKRLWRREPDERAQLKLARFLTVIYGGAVLLLSFAVQRLGTLLEAANIAVGVVGGPVLGLFLLGMLSARARAGAAVIGSITGFIVSLLVALAGEVSFLWHALIGCVTTVVVGWTIGLFLAPPNEKHIAGLVLGRSPRIRSHND